MVGAAAGAMAERFDPATDASTISATATIKASSCSCRKSAAHTSDSIGCNNWTWLTRAMPPSAKPAYQAKNQRNIDTMPR